MSIQCKLALAVALLALVAGTSYGQNPDAQFVAGDSLWMRPQYGIMGIAENGTKFMAGMYPDILLVDPATGNELYRIEGVEPSNNFRHDPNLRYACFNSYGPNKRGWIWKVYDLDERRLVYERYSPDTMFIQGMAIANDRIVVGHYKRGSLLISMSSGDTIATLRGQPVRVDDEIGMAYMMDNSVLDIVNLVDGRVERTFSTPAVGPRQFTVSKDGKYIIYTISSTKNVSIISIDVATGIFKDISSVLGTDKGYWCCTEQGMYLQRDEEGRYVYLSGMYSTVDRSAVVLRFDQQTLKEDVILYSTIDQPPFFTSASYVMVDAKRMNLVYSSKVQNMNGQTVCRGITPVSSVAVDSKDSQRIHVESDATQLTVHVEGVDTDSQVRVDLYDMQGRRVREMVLSADGRASIATTDLVPGTYVVTCDIHGQRYSRSVVISR